MTKRIRTVSLVIGLFCLLGFAAVWVKYSLAIEESNKIGLELACKENMAQEFRGHLIEVDRFENDSYMHDHFFNLRIKVDDSTNSYIDYHYNLKPNAEILDFAKSGQQVLKSRGEDTFTLIDSFGVRKTFKIAKCADYE